MIFVKDQQVYHKLHRRGYDQVTMVNPGFTPNGITLVVGVAAYLEYFSNLRPNLDIVRYQTNVKVVHSSGVVLLCADKLKADRFLNWYKILRGLYVN